MYRHSRAALTCQRSRADGISQQPFTTLFFFKYIIYFPKLRVILQIVFTNVVQSFIYKCVINLSSPLKSLFCQTEDDDKDSVCECVLYYFSDMIRFMSSNASRQQKNKIKIDYNYIDGMHRRDKQLINFHVKLFML